MKRTPSPWLSSPWLTSPWLWLSLAAATVAAIAAVSASDDFGATSSALARDARGWLAARRYLEASGAEVRLRDTPLAAEPRIDEADAPGVLVLAFPWQLPVTDDDVEAVGGFLRAGGTVLLAYSGEPPAPREEQVLAGLGLETREVRPPPPLAPRPWWRYHREVWTLAGGEQGLLALTVPALTVPAFQEAPVPPAGAAVLYRGGGGAADTPLVFSYPLHRGRVVALPAATLANAWLANAWRAGAGNADLLATLLAWLGDGWTFDEYHHGLVSAAPAAASEALGAWDLFVAHLALVYLLGLLALVRRFGPAWREPAAAAGTTSGFLRHLGGLHHQLGHHRRAAELLLERVRALEPQLALPEDTAPAGDAAGFLRLAREVAHVQRRREP